MQYAMLGLCLLALVVLVAGGIMHAAGSSEREIERLKDGGDGDKPVDGQTKR